MSISCRLFIPRQDISKACGSAVPVTLDIGYRHVSWQSGCRSASTRFRDKMKTL